MHTIAQTEPKRHYTPLPISFEIPEELEDDINRYVDYLNTGETLTEDCYQMEVKTSINWCFREKILTDDQIQLLRDYYLYGGIHEGES